MRIGGAKGRWTPYDRIALMHHQSRLICHVIHRLAVGGLENGLVNIVNNLPTEDFRHAIVCVTGSTTFRQRLCRRDVEIYEIGKRPGKDIVAYGRMWRVLRQLRPDIVHTRNLPALDMILPAWMAGVRRFVHSEHGLDLVEIDGKNARYNNLRRLSRLFVDRYVTVSADLEQWMQHEIGIPRPRLQTIYNGVDTARFSPMAKDPATLPAGFAPPGAFVVGTLGRLDPLKNQIWLAQAFCHILVRHPELRSSLRLVIVGEGELRRDVEAILAAANALDLAWMPGFRDDTPQIYRAIDLFVLPSLREGVSNTILEALASGRPVVAARVGGNPEIVADGLVGRLVRSTDPETLAAAILDYVSDPPVLHRHGEAARAHVLQHYSLASMVASYDRLYRSLAPYDPMPAP